MGCGQSTPEPNPIKPDPIKPDSSKHDEQIPDPDAIPIHQGDFKKEDFKILTLGAGECGKTTLWRQLKIAYCNGFSEEEKETLKGDIKMNILEDITTLINNAQNNNQNIPSEIDEDVTAIKDCEYDSADDLTEEIAKSISNVWADPVIKQIYQQANSIGIGENADYFLDNVEKIAKEDYKLTDEDILKARIRTIGIHNLMLEVGNAKSKTILTDVGGQRNERKNWAACFNNVTFVMFVISLSDFDQVMFEDENTTRTEDSIDLFTNIASSPQFKNVPFFLILNKYDIFTKKLKKYPEAFRKTYPGFEGDINSEADCVEHIKKTFMEHLPERESEAWIEAITTCAMDQKSVRKLLQQIAKKIVEKVEPKAE